MSESTAKMPPTEGADTLPDQEDIPTVVPERHLTSEATQVPVEDGIEAAPHGVAFIEVGGGRTAPKRPQRPKALPSASYKAAANPKTAFTIPKYRLVTLVSALRSLSIAFAAAVILSTIFMWWTSPDFLPIQARLDLAPVQATARLVSAPTLTPLPTPAWFNRVGILAGHTGLTAADGSKRDQQDPGAVCADGFFERSVTEAVAARAAAILRGRGFTVDVLEEFDPRLNGYEAAVFISLHADSCENFGYGGFKSAFPAARTLIRDLDTTLNECVRANYGGITGLEFQAGSITDNMRQYHAFRKISPRTPANILELGFLSYDRQLLQNEPDRLAVGVANGIMCFLPPPDQGPQSAPTPTRAQP